MKLFLGFRNDNDSKIEKQNKKMKSMFILIRDSFIFS